MTAIKEMEFFIWHKTAEQRGHSLKLVAQHSKIEIRRNCLAVRVVAPWNSLPEFVVSSTNVQLFESRLDKVWSNQPVRFCYKEELRL